MKVELIESMGSDLSIVNAARVSYAKESDWEYWCPRLAGKREDADDECRTCICGPDNRRRIAEKDAGLISYLMKNRHGTPFEMVQFKFRVTCPIGVSREWMRHRIGSFNEISTRYVEMEPKFYEPPRDAWRKQIGKPGHYEMVPVEDDALAEGMAIVMHRAYEAAYGSYLGLLSAGVAKELARNVLPLGLMTQFIWSVNARALFNFLSLRTHETALLEIRQLASEVEELVTPKVPVAMKAWNDNGRIAP